MFFEKPTRSGRREGSEGLLTHFKLLKTWICTSSDKLKHILVFMVVESCRGRRGGTTDHYRGPEQIVLARDRTWLKSGDRATSFREDTSTCFCLDRILKSADFASQPWSKEYWRFAYSYVSIHERWVFQIKRSLPTSIRL